MIARIVTGAGSNRQQHALPNKKGARIELGNVLKRHLFPTGRSFMQAKKRGVAALAGQVAKKEAAYA